MEKGLISSQFDRIWERDSAGESEPTNKYKLKGLLLKKQRARLIKRFREFNDRKKDTCPDLDLDLGYALAPLNDGVLGKPLAKVASSKMRPSVYPQISVSVDSFGDVFLYREAGFLHRPGNERFIAGRITAKKLLEDVIREFIENHEEIRHNPHDSRFMDAFDHLVTLFLNKAEHDRKIGIPFQLGPVDTPHPHDKAIDRCMSVFGTFHQ